MVAALAPLVLGGCSSASDPIAAAGVDELVVPTPTPQPSDFVARIDNPWFPLEPGGRLTYSDQDGARVVASVVVGPVVAGVATTAVTTLTTGTAVTGQGPAERRTDDYAQDARGDVWWFGREGVWRAGEDGAEAGLVMAAVPRVGDGYVLADAPPALRASATVVSVDATATTPAGRWTDVVVLEVVSGSDPQRVQRISSARGVGVVEVATLTSGPPPGHPSGAVVPQSSLHLVRVRD